MVRTDKEEARILGLVGGDTDVALSGVARHLLDAVAKRFPVVGRIDYAPHGLSRLGLATGTFRPSRSAWRAQFHSSLTAHRALERLLVSRTRGLDGCFDLALQVHGWVTGQPRPYAVFIDQTRIMADRGWPGWVPLPTRQRSRLLALERQMYGEAEHVFTMSAVARHSVVEEYGISPDQVTAVGGGPNFDQLPRAAGPAMERAILFIGREFERKGGGCLMEAFHEVRQRLGDVTLHIVGSRPRVRVRGVIAHGRIRDRHRLAELYRSARACCLPSLYEPYGLVLLEAMAHGVPCVGTAVQAIPEILDDGRAGLLVPPGDPQALAGALVAVLEDYELARSLGAAGRRFVESRLTWDHVVGRMAPAIRAAGR